MPAEIASSAIATQADTDVILDLLDKIREQNTPVADALANLAYNFRFDIIVDLTQQTGVLLDTQN